MKNKHKSKEVNFLLEFKELTDSKNFRFNFVEKNPYERKILDDNLVEEVLEIQTEEEKSSGFFETLKKMSFLPIIILIVIVFLICQCCKKN